MAKDLTIVSAYHNPLSKRLLELNSEFTHALNPGVDIEWLVADNMPGDFIDEINEDCFTVIPNKEDYHGLGSHQHAGGINKCLKQVKTRFVLSLDSDFYIVREGWINSVIEHMKKNNLAFFGATCHSRDYSKFRYFPSVACMFVDLEKVPLNALDFLPMMEFKETGQVIRTEKDRGTKKKTLRKKLKRFLPDSITGMLAKIIRTLDMRQRKMVIETARDTSYRIYARYGNDKRFRREYATVVFDPYREAYLRQRIWSPLNRIVEALIPDRFCYVPKCRGSFSAKGFKEQGFSDLRGFGWEEYLWQGNPFGTHIRGSKTWKRNESEDNEIKSIKQELATFIKKDLI